MLNFYFYIYIIKINVYVCIVKTLFKQMIDIENILKREKVSKVELAKRMDVSREYLYRILDGNPTLETLEKLAKALRVPVRDLFPEDNNSITCPNCGKRFVMEDSHIRDHENIRGKEYYK